MKKTKKIKASELLLKLRDAVIKLIEQHREMRKVVENLNARIGNLERKYDSLVRTIEELKTGLKTAERPIKAAPVEREESFVDLELEDLAKELGLGGELETKEAKVEEIPPPPPPPPIKRREREEVLSADRILGDREAKREDIEKEKDELLKVLRELDELK